MGDRSSINISNSMDGDETRAALSEIQKALANFLLENQNLTVSGLAMRCSISEPTLRRIRNGDIKTLPSITTIIKLLGYLCKETSVPRIVAHFPGPIANYLMLKYPQTEMFNRLVVIDGEKAFLHDSVRYLIYKLSANHCGVSVAKVIELFGNYGHQQLLALLQDGLVERRGETIHSSAETFSVPHEDFVEHFKCTASFIKPNKLPNAPRSQSPVFANFSAGLTSDAYAEIVRIQRYALKKIAKVMSQDSKQGHIPTFVLGAIDTLDSDAAYEFPTKPSP